MWEVSKDQFKISYSIIQQFSSQPDEIVVYFSTRSQVALPGRDRGRQKQRGKRRGGEKRRESGGGRR